MYYTYIINYTLTLWLQFVEAEKHRKPSMQDLENIADGLE